MASSKKEALAQDSAVSNDKGPLLGALLTQAREKQKLSIDEVANQLRLSVKQITALEQDDFAMFSSAMLVKGFIKNYARLLNLDSLPLLAAYALLAPPELIQSISYQPASANVVLSAQSNKPRSKMLFLGGLFLVAVITWLFYANSKLELATQSTEISLVEPLVDSASSPSVLPEAALPAAERETQAEPVVVPEPLPAKVVAAPVPVAGSVKVKFTFTDSSWVSVQDRDGKTVLSKLAQKGSSEEVFGLPPLNLLIGNASATSVLLEGKPVDLSAYNNNNVVRMTLPAE